MEIGPQWLDLKSHPRTEQSVGDLKLDGRGSQW